MPSKIKLLTAATCAALLVQASAASAAMFEWSYTGTNGYIALGTGLLKATPLGGGTYQVTSIQGLVDGQAVTGLTDYAGQDNLVYTPVPHLDYPGLAFTVGSSAYNVYYDGGTSDAYSCGFIGYCEIGPGASGTSGLGPPSDPIHSIDFTLRSVPEPATWAMLLIGFGGLGAVLRRRHALAA